MMRIGLATAKDPRSRLTWSGTPSFMADALARQGAEVVPLGPLRARLEQPARALNKLSERLVQKRLADRHLIPLARTYGHRLADLARQKDVDVVFAPAGGQLIAYAELTVPVVYSSDATFALMTDYYADFSGLYAFSRRHGHLIEARAIDRADLILYPSEWAATSAVRDYGADSRKLRVLPYGANLDDVPKHPPRKARDFRRTGVRLLFVGVDWTRKGGDTALETLSALSALGIPASLTVCGCTPPPSALAANIQVQPFVDKTDPIGRARVAELYASHDLLLFPTRREAYGIVVAEASAFGLPTLARATGGVSGVLAHRVNGYILPEDAEGSAYARAIADLVDNPAAYAELCRTSRAHYKRCLNWNSWAAAAIAEISQVTGRRTRAPAA